MADDKTKIKDTGNSQDLKSDNKDTQELIKNQKILNEARKQGFDFMSATRKEQDEFIKGLRKATEEAEALSDHVEDWVSYTAEYNRLLTKANTTAGTIKKIYDDKAKTLKESYTSEYNLYKLSERQRSLTKETDELIKKHNEERQRDLDDYAAAQKNLINFEKEYQDKTISFNADLKKAMAEKLITGDEMGDLMAEWTGEQTKMVDEKKKELDAIQNIGLANKLMRQDELGKLNAIRDSLEHALLLSNKQKIVQGSTNAIFGQHTDKLGKIGKSFIELGHSAKNMVTTLAKGGNPMNAMLTMGLAFKGVAEQILDILFAQNKEITTLQNNLMVSGDAAREMRDRMVEIEASAGGALGAFVTTKNLMEAQLGISQSLGASFDMSVGKGKEMLMNQISLNKEYGLSAEEASKFSSTLTWMGKSEKQFGEEVTKTTLAEKRRSGITISTRDVMKEISKLGAATFLSFNRYPEALQKSVVIAKKLGLEMAQMDAMARGTLDIESSITAQFEATVLTGKTLNFERSRELALQNKTAEAVDLMLKQMGSAAEFGKLNRIQQEAMAKAVGMSRDELASSMMTQEKLNMLGGEQKELLQKRLEGLDEEQKKKILASITDEKSALEASKKIAAQEKMAQQQEKFNSMITNLLSELEPVLDVFVTIFDIIGGIVGFVANLLKSLGILKPILGVIAGLLGVLAAKTLFTTIATIIGSAFKAFHMMGPAGWIMGTVAAAAGISMLMSQTSKANSVKDAMISPKGGLVVSGEKGTFQLDKDDTVVAGTDIGKTNSTITERKTEKNITNTNNTSNTSGGINLDKLLTAIEKLTQAIITNPTSITINEREFAALVRNTTETRVARA